MLNTYLFLYFYLSIFLQELPAWFIWNSWAGWMNWKGMCGIAAGTVGGWSKCGTIGVQTRAYRQDSLFFFVFSLFSHTAPPLYRLYWEYWLTCNNKIKIRNRRTCLHCTKLRVRAAVKLCCYYTMSESYGEETLQNETIHTVYTSW